jgi:hypothetical protein
VARCLNLNPAAKDGMTVGIANGELLPCLGVCYTLSFSIHGEPLWIDFVIIALLSYEVVLGCNWLWGPLFGTSRAFLWCSDDLTIGSSGQGWAPPGCKHLLSPPTTSCIFSLSSQTSSLIPWVCHPLDPSTTAFISFCLCHQSPSSHIDTHNC